MKTILQITALLLSLSLSVFSNDEWKKTASPSAQKKLLQIEKVKINKINLEYPDAHTAFQELKRVLGKHGLKVRLHKSDLTKPVVVAPRRVELKLVNIPATALMDYFTKTVRWAWRVSDDGSIVFYESLCMCGHPIGSGKHP